MTRTEYTITLKPLASDIPPIIRIRKALKLLLRCYRLECRDIREQQALEPFMASIGTELSGTAENAPAAQQTALASNLEGTE